LELGIPSSSQATWKKPAPKPNSQAINSKNNLNQKCNPKHKQKIKLDTQKGRQQQPKKEKKLSPFHSFFGSNPSNNTKQTSLQFLKLQKIKALPIYNQFFVFIQWLVGNLVLQHNNIF
jgi:hypothetical protein